MIKRTASTKQGVSFTEKRIEYLYASAAEQSPRRSFFRYSSFVSSPFLSSNAAIYAGRSAA
ncbi:MAG TPA: hypothetical protein DCE65_04500 [Clostridiales bacterium]|nr:hypothetical protein [Clostridiales bacterium]